MSINPLELYKKSRKIRDINFNDIIKYYNDNKDDYEERNGTFFPKYTSDVVLIGVKYRNLKKITRRTKVNNKYVSDYKNSIGGSPKYFFFLAKQLGVDTTQKPFGTSYGNVITLENISDKLEENKITTIDNLIEKDLLKSFIRRKNGNLIGIYKYSNTYENQYENALNIECYVVNYKNLLNFLSDEIIKNENMYDLQLTKLKNEYKDFVTLMPEDNPDKGYIGETYRKAKDDWYEKINPNYYKESEELSQAKEEHKTKMSPIRRALRKTIKKTGGKNKKTKKNKNIKKN